MTKNLDNDGLQSIAENYDLFYIDLWGVIHNGIKLHEKAVYALNQLVKINKNFVLLTNAPRPNRIVNMFLEKMGMEKSSEIMFLHQEKHLLVILKNFSNLINFFILVPKEILIYLMILDMINQKI